MTSSNNRGNTAPTGHLSSSNETSSTVNELHIIEPLAKEVPREPSNNPGYFQNFGGSPQTDYTHIQCCLGGQESRQDRPGT